MTKIRTEPVRLLGIEAGGTQTIGILEECYGDALEGMQWFEFRLGPANLQLLNDRHLLHHFRVLSKGVERPDAIAIGMAGARTELDRARIRRAAAVVWPRVPCYATNDLETALEAAADLTDHRAFRHLGKKQPGDGRYADGREMDNILMIPRILILSGTGSCCFGRTREGKTAKIGGWGHILGDKGSGYEIGLRALKAVVCYYDCDGVWSKLGRRLLRKLEFNEPDDLIRWVQSAGKDDVAALAVEVFDAWRGGDQIAADVLDSAASSLAKDGLACARRLVKHAGPVHFVLAGGVFRHQPRFARKVAHLLRQSWPKAIVAPLKRESAWGAVELAKREFHVSRSKFQIGKRRASVRKKPEQPVFPEPDSLERSPTEKRNPRSRRLDKLSVAEAIALIWSEDEKIPAAIRAERTKIEQAIKLIVRAFKRDGRLLYVGAGTSGRLGVLDASECPPTFRTPAERVQGIIAGGQRALWEAVEGAEDDPLAGARAVQFRGVSRNDVVVGIAASGRTPFVWGALGEARNRGAKTILLCFNPHLVIPRRNRPDLMIAPNVGPEILTGSTRLKSGTATKLILNIFTTLAMVRMGKVISNLMVDVNPSNVKLRNRAVRIVCELTGVDESAAKQALEKTRWVVEDACRRLGTRMD